MEFKLVSDKSVEVNGIVFNTDFPIRDLNDKQIEDFKWYINSGIITEVSNTFTKIEKIKDIIEDSVEKIKESTEVIIDKVEEVIEEVKETITEIKEVVEDKKVAEKTIQPKKKK